MGSEKTKHVDVLIVGAGPAGMMLAVQLLRHGISPYIIDNQKPDESKNREPVLLQPRTAEFFEQLNMLNLMGHVTWYTGAIDLDGTKPKRVSITAPKAYNPSVKNQGICNFQAIEKPLIHWLTDNACPIHWRTEIIRHSQDDHGLNVVLTETGSQLSLSCKWLVHTLPVASPHYLISQRTVFIGEAIGRPMPEKGQSVNTDIQDAINLGWKLALVAGERASVKLLNSYVAERSGIPPEIIALDKGAILVWPEPVLGGRLVKSIRNVVFRYRLRSPAFVTHFRAVATQLAINYRNSPLSVHHSLGQKIRAGDRLPCLEVFDEKTKTHTNLHNWCDKPGFTLLLLGTLPANSLFVMGQWVRQAFPRTMHLYYLPYSPANDTVFRAFELKPGNTRMILVRPDMYIGYMNDTIGANLIETYMHEITKYGRQKE